MFFRVFKICRKHRIVNFGSKNAFLCKFLEAKEVCPPKWTDLLKGFGYWERKYVFPHIFAANGFFDYSEADIEYRYF